MITALWFTMMLQNPGGDDARLQARFERYLQEEFARHPVFASAMGNREHDDRLDDLSPAARRADAARLDNLIDELTRDFNPARLSRDARIDYEIWLHALKLQQWQRRHDDRFSYDPRIYGEYHTDSVFQLLTQSTQPRERNVANAARRITQVPRVLAAARESLHRPPRVLTEVAIQRTKGSIAFYEKDIYTVAGETPAISELKQPCTAAAAALKDYLHWLETELLPRSDGDWRLGPARFAEKLDLELNAGWNAAEVLRAAEAEADRVERELYVLAKQLWFRGHPGRALPPDDADGRREVVAAVLDQIAENRSTPESLLADTQGTVASIRAFIQQRHILTLPEPDRCEIILMPAFQRGYSVAYMNNAPPLDPNARSFYAISPPLDEWPPEIGHALLKEYNRLMLQVLTIHEAYPGHYVQLEYAQRHPSLIRKVFANGVFIEGWAVYTEQMMLDQGYGDGDPALRMQQLKFYLRAVLNAILDHRMHCTELTDDEAVLLLTRRGFQTQGEAVAKVQRAKQQSGQLSTYFVGRMAFDRLRQQVQRQRGDAFNLAQFHEAVLSHGSVPVKYLPELVK